MAGTFQHDDRKYGSGTGKHLRPVSWMKGTSTMKLWSGRFGKDTDALVNELNASISFDQRLYKEDITGSMAHAAMLAKQGIVSEEDGRRIRDGLAGILADIE